jgi:hypothetical protein
LANSFKKICGVAAEITEFRDREWNEADVEATSHPSGYFSNLVFSTTAESNVG